jgi:hypothetical protein
VNLLRMVLKNSTRFCDLCKVSIRSQAVNLLASLPRKVRWAFSVDRNKPFGGKSLESPSSGDLFFVPTGLVADCFEGA